ncbi:extracellular solute-binding protein [Saxibacter everestensis]|uniref:Extracellular solute-binding protein n=1 Tax=Saxibacter everestensis TaxID=2909229 RepID=A0ABY8QW66_9MICO|nr:extracellular solute-binding protein [Brevibacteriaceae bacterium ZFBP1038]
MRISPARRCAAAIACCLLIAGLSGCRSAESASNPKQLTVWNLDSQPDRIAAVKKINEKFTAETGITVEEVAVQENQLPSLIVSAAVSGTVPDLIAGLPLAYVRQLNQQELLDTGAAQQVVADLDPDTFEPSAIELTRKGSTQLAVPSDFWTQILVYRKDLFEKHGLAPPTTYAAIREAAKTLTSGDQYGITLATDPADPFTQQTFESLALGNDCQMVDQAGAVRLDSPNCKEAFSLYAQLAQQNSPQGTQTVDSTRATYFAGQAGMIIWSTFLLDELGGLRDDARPTCKECQEDPEWLAKNSGVVTAVQGPDGSGPAGYGDIPSWGIMKDASPRTIDYVNYMMSDGYEAALAIAPEGKYPARQGTPDDPEKFLTAWAGMPAGVNTEKSLAEIYGQDTMDQITQATSRLDRWAIPQGQGDLLGPVVAELAIPRVLSALAIGEDPNQAAEDATTAVKDIEVSLR